MSPPGRLVRAHPGRGHPEPLGRVASTPRGSSPSSAPWPRRGGRPAPGRCPATPTVGPDGQLQVISDPPFVEPLSELAGIRPRPSSAPSWRRSSPSTAASLPDDLEGPARRLPGRSTPHARSWVWDRSAPGAGSPCSWGRTIAIDDLVLQFKQAGASVLESVDRPSALRTTTAAGRGGPAADAGRQRHAPGLDPGPGARRRRTATSTSARCGTGRPRRTSRRWTTWPCRSTPGCAAGRWPGPCPQRRPVRHRRLPRVGRTFTRAMQDFADSYADQNQRDYDGFLRAIAEDRIPRAPRPRPG